MTVRAGQALPDVFGDERHDGMEEPERHLEHMGEKETTGLGCSRILRSRKPDLDKLKVPIAVLVPEELIDVGGSIAKPIILQCLGYRRDHVLKAAQDPSIRKIRRGRQLSSPQTIRITLGEMHAHKPIGIPDLVAEVAISFNSFFG
jgi:hypothetical protein